MDDQQQNQQLGSVQNNVPVQNSQSGVSQQQSADISLPQASVGSIHKEQELAGSTHSEVAQPAEKEPVLAPEVKEAGVEAISEAPQLTLEDKKAGIEPAKESVPVPTQPSGAVKLPPITQEEAVHVLKNRSFHKAKKAIVWLATLFLRQVQRSKLEGD